MNKMWIKYAAVTLLALGPVFCGYAQYYYKDIVVTSQISDNFRLLKTNKVSSIAVLPYENGIPTRDGVNIDQTVYPSQNMVVTHTKVPDATESWLKSHYNNSGALIATADSVVGVTTRSTYQYNAAGQLTGITSKTESKDNPTETEAHLWTYNSNGKPVSMMKIKDNLDTTFVTFESDEQGNPGVEKAARRKSSVIIYYYYYDAKNRLTDVAQENKKANRILPSYIFEYNETGQLSQMIVIPEGAVEYQTWKYFYTPEGLKRQDVCFSKQKQLLGKVEYQYQFSK